MAEAVADHRAARSGSAAWMLGRFLSPAGRMEELAAENPGPDWELGCVLAPEIEDWPASVRTQLEAVRAYGGAGTVRAIELPLPSGAPAGEPVAEAVRAVGETIDDGRGPEPVELFLELPVDAREESDLLAALEAIAEARVGAGPAPACLPMAKLRCGGPTPDHFPADRLIAIFITSCRRLDLPFKLTAGLHHPFRTPDPETGTLQHGFVNLLAATALAAGAADAPEAAGLEPIVAEGRPESFAIDRRGIAWRGSRAGPEAVAAARRLFTSFGSCSFSEPLEDLAAHGVLPEPHAAAGADG